MFTKAFKNSCLSFPLLLWGMLSALFLTFSLSVTQSTLFSLLSLPLLLIHYALLGGILCKIINPAMPYWQGLRHYLFRVFTGAFLLALLTFLFSMLIGLLASLLGSSIWVTLLSLILGALPTPLYLLWFPMMIQEDMGAVESFVKAMFLGFQHYFRLLLPSTCFALLLQFLPQCGNLLYLWSHYALYPDLPPIHLFTFFMAPLLSLVLLWQNHYGFLFLARYQKEDT